MPWVIRRMKKLIQQEQSQEEKFILDTGDKGEEHFLAMLSGVSGGQLDGNT